ncbi:MAG: LrgB family protein [Saccharospirillum sp.]|jgi:putative effector of murein hydrolase
MTVSIQMLLALSLTIGVYLAAEQLYIKAGKSSLVHPVIISIFSLMGIITLLGWDYPQYQRDTQLIHFLLGPATVALAVPLYDNMKLIRQMAVPLLLACLSGAIVAAASAVVLVDWWAGDAVLSLSMSAKSITTPIAIGMAESIGGSGSLAAGLVLLAGAVGTLLLPTTLRLLRLNNDALHGFVLGLTAHGFGTAQAFERSVTCGAFAGLSMSLTGVATAFLVPPLVPWLV